MMTYCLSVSLYYLKYDICQLLNTYIPASTYLHKIGAWLWDNLIDY